MLQSDLCLLFNTRHGSYFANVCNAASQPNLNLFAIPGSKDNHPSGLASSFSVWLILKPVIYFLLLGIPKNYQRRISRADWVQWASSKRWIDQREAFNGFINSLLSEWNLINLIVGLVISFHPRFPLTLSCHAIVYVVLLVSIPVISGSEIG